MGLLTDVDITKSGQALSELLDIGLVGLGLVAITVLGAALLLNVEAQVLEEDDGTVVGLVDDGLDLGADTVGGEGDGLAQKALELGDDGLKGVLGVGGAVGTAKVGHEDDGLGAIVNGVLDGRKGTNNALVVCDFLVLVKGDVEVDLYFFWG